MIPSFDLENDGIAKLIVLATTAYPLRTIYNGCARTADCYDRTGLCLRAEIVEACIDNIAEWGGQLHPPM